MNYSLRCSVWPHRNRHNIHSTGLRKSENTRLLKHDVHVSSCMTVKNCNFICCKSEFQHDREESFCFESNNNMDLTVCKILFSDASIAHCMLFWKSVCLRTNSLHERGWSISWISDASGQFSHAPKPIPARYRCTGSKKTLYMMRWTLDPRIHRSRSYLQMARVVRYIVAAITNTWCNTAHTIKTTYIKSPSIPSARNLEHNDSALKR